MSNLLHQLDDILHKKIKSFELSSITFNNFKTAFSYIFEVIKYRKSREDFEYLYKLYSNDRDFLDSIKYIVDQLILLVDSDPNKLFKNTQLRFNNLDFIKILLSNIKIDKQILFNYVCSINAEVDIIKYFGELGTKLDLSALFEMDEDKIIQIIRGSLFDTSDLIDKLEPDSEFLKYMFVIGYRIHKLETSSDNKYFRINNTHIIKNTTNLLNTIIDNKIYYLPHIVYKSYLDFTEISSHKYVTMLTKPIIHMIEKPIVEIDDDKLSNILECFKTKVYKSYVIPDKIVCSAFTIINYYTRTGFKAMHSTLKGEYVAILDEYLVTPDDDIYQLNIAEIPIIIVCLNKFIWHVHITYLHEADKCNIEKNIKLYSGGGSNNDIIPYTPGSIINHSINKFQSFTTFFSEAEKFAKPYIFELILDFSTDVVLPICNIKIDGNYISNFAEEGEFLLPINTSFIVSGQPYFKMNNDTQIPIIPVKVYKQVPYEEFRVFTHRETTDVISLETVLYT
jgi:hypothetical protein